MGAKGRNIHRAVWATFFIAASFPMAGFTADGAAEPAAAPATGGRGYSAQFCNAVRVNTLRESIGLWVWTGLGAGVLGGVLAAGSSSRESQGPIIWAVVGGGIGAVVGAIMGDQKAPECSTTNYPMVMNPGRPEIAPPLLLCQADFLF